MGYDDFSSNETMIYAIQPSAWAKLDEWGCDWAPDIHTAYRIGKAWGEECMIWMCPPAGEPIRWCRTDANTNAIADLVFGVAK